MRTRFPGSDSHREIVDLPRDHEGWAYALPILQQLRPAATANLIRTLLDRDDQQGVRFIGVFDDGVCHGVAGYRVMLTTSSGRKLHVDDLVTDASRRSSGVGRVMMDELIRRAAAGGCSTLELDSGVQRFDAHRFYLDRRMSITAHHFGLHL